MIKIPRGKVIHVKAKQDTSLEGQSGKVYEFKAGQEYLARVLFLNLSQIGVDMTKVAVNTTWLFQNFDYVQELKS